MEVYIIVISFITLMMVVGYACMRAIDYFFTKGDDKRRYNYAKGLIRYGGKQATRMSDQVIASINKNMFDAIQKMEDR